MKRRTVADCSDSTDPILLPAQRLPIPALVPVVLPKLEPVVLPKLGRAIMPEPQPEVLKNLI